MAAGYTPERLLEWYESNREGGGSSASSRSGQNRSVNLEKAEQAARAGKGSRAVLEALYDLPF